MHFLYPFNNFIPARDSKNYSNHNACIYAIYITYYSIIDTIQIWLDISFNAIISTIT